MADRKQQPDEAANVEYGAAGKETGIEEPSEMGTAGVYAAPIHEEGEEALEAGREKSGKPSR